jgi:hypothetical protein
MLIKDTRKRKEKERFNPVDVVYRTWLEERRLGNLRNVLGRKNERERERERVCVCVSRLGGKGDRAHMMLLA